MVTHNANIADIATKVIKMNSGRIIEAVTNANPADVDGIGW
jgi:putative ABC transport system ATP-binding protein